MGLRTQPEPARLPLPGGSEGATVRVRPLLTGEALMPPGFFERPDGPLGYVRGLGLATPKSRWTWIPVPAFLVEHPTAGPILIDTGLDASVAEDPARNLGRRHKLTFKERMEAGQAVPAQLEALGIAPGDVRLVVMSHLHYDHASGIGQFPGATFVVTRAEWEWAAGHGFLKGYRQQLFDTGGDWRLVDFDAPETESHATFGRTLDLLGDGSVRLVSTPGHTMGHQSVLLRLGGGRELLVVADAADTRRHLDEDLDTLFRDDEHLYFRSLHEVRHYAQSTPDAVVIPGHDHELWPRLDAVYE